MPCSALYSRSKENNCRHKRTFFALIVLGGAIWGVAPCSLQEVGANYGVVGEGEVAFVELLKHLDRGDNPSVERSNLS